MEVQAGLKVHMVDITVVYPPDLADLAVVVLVDLAAADLAAVEPEEAGSYG